MKEHRSHTRTGAIILPFSFLISIRNIHQKRSYHQIHTGLSFHVLIWLLWLKKKKNLKKTPRKYGSVLYLLFRRQGISCMTQFTWAPAQQIKDSNVFQFWQSPGILSTLSYSLQLAVSHWFPGPCSTLSVEHVTHQESPNPCKLTGSGFSSF